MNIKTAYFEITNQCNLNCATCYNRSGLSKERLEISATKLTESIKILSAYGLERVLISGGEPTLHSDFENVLDLVNENPSLSFGIVTNGTVYNQKLIDMLNTRNNFTLQVSLDGSDDKQNAKTRGKGNFNKAIEFTRQIHNNSFKPLLKMVVSQNNINDVADFYCLAVSLDFVPEFAFVNRRGNACDDWNSMWLSSKQKMKIIKQIDALNKEFCIEAFLPLCTTGCPYADGMKNLSLCIKPNGEIQPCSMLYESEYSLGNLFEFDEKHFNQRLLYISDLAAKRAAFDYGCGRCILQNHCNKGCMASAFLLNGEVLADDGECELRKMQLVGFSLQNIRK